MFYALIFQGAEKINLVELILCLCLGSRQLQNRELHHLGGFNGVYKVTKVTDFYHELRNETVHIVGCRKQKHGENCIGDGSKLITAYHCANFSQFAFVFSSGGLNFVLATTFQTSLHCFFSVTVDRLCGPVVRVLDYRSRGPEFDPRALQNKSSGSGTGSTQPREYN
jgi:hypothetical protein